MMPPPYPTPWLYLEDEDLVGVYDGGEAVGHNNGGPVLANLHEGGLYVALCLCVQC